MTRYVIQFNVVFISVFLAGVVMGTPSFAAEKTLTVAVAPPVFQVNLSNGDVWKSTLKVVNPNAYTMLVRVFVTDMKKGGVVNSFEIPVDSMERWVEVPKQQLFINPEQSIEVPFTIRVPYDAPPGGHYAFLLVGIEPEADGSPKKEEGGVSSYVSASLFVRVGGDIREGGDFREFSTEKIVYEKADVPFRIRFENVGNVHIRPHGAIVVYDIWGQQKMMLPINEGDNARVLFPRTLQVFSPHWVSDRGVLETGFYRAEAQLRFGENDARVVKNSLYFFVIPFKELAFGVIVLLMSLVSIGYAIRMYIRWALTLESRRLGLDTESIDVLQREKRHVLLAPLAESIVDLRSAYQGVEIKKHFFKKYNIILLSIFFLAMGISYLVYLITF